MMSAFWIIVSLLTGCVLLLLLSPLLRRAPEASLSRDEMNTAVYRDQLSELEKDVASGTLSRAGYEEARGELEHRLLEDVGSTDTMAPSTRGTAWRTAVAMGVSLPVAAFALYVLVGSPQAMLQGDGAIGAQAQHSISSEELKAMAARLATRMEKEPDDVEGWIMLGRSYRIIGDFTEAARAYANAVARSGPDAGLLADYADMLAMAQGQKLAGEPEKILQRALAIDPRNVKALALAGSAAFERRNYTAAVSHWERIVQIAPPDSELARSIRSSLEEARELAQRPDAAVAKGAPAERGPGATAGTVSGIIELAPSLAPQAAPADTLFVFARAVEGPRMPIAIVRAQVKDLPLRFTLDDSSAMAPGVNLSSHKRVIVGARISKSGNAMQQSGDLEGYSAPIDVGRTGIQITIDTRVP